MSILSHKNGWVLRKNDGLACTCTPANPRHVRGWYCVTPEQMAVWRAHNPDYAGTQARWLTWLWLHFSQDPEAKRLSGREVSDFIEKARASLAESERLNPGLDQWDDDAGMSELQKGMFP